MNKTENDLQPVATLPSDDGWDSLTMGFVRALRHEGQDVVLAWVRVAGQFWDREKSLDSFAEAELTDDYHAHLPQVLIAGGKLRQLIHVLEDWLRTRSDFALDISREDCQSMSLSIGQRDDLIWSEHHPAFTLRYSAPRMQAEFYVVTDQSCLRIFVQGLKEWLQILPSSIA